jgi:FkbM family methyltransferase
MACDEYRLGRIRFEPGDVIVDVGAHVGMVAIWLALRNPQVTVIAVEPEPFNLSHLRANIAANGVDNIVVVPLALTADRRTLPMARPPSNSGGRRLLL